MVEGSAESGGRLPALCHRRPGPVGRPSQNGAGGDLDRSSKGAGKKPEHQPGTPGVNPLARADLHVQRLSQGRLARVDHAQETEAS